MPDILKAAAISDVGKLVREYKNQHDILEMSLSFLGDTAYPEKLDGDWLAYFFEGAKNIGKEEMQIIWGKLLAKEINEPSSVSKQLIHILSIIDKEEAEAFQKLAKFTVIIDETPYLLIFFNRFEEIYSKYNMKQEEIFRLEDIGLLQESGDGYEICVTEGPENVKYFGFEIQVKEDSYMALGNVSLSRAGRELMSIITKDCQVEGFEYILKNVVGKKMCDLDILKT